MTEVVGRAWGAEKSADRGGKSAGRWRCVAALFGALLISGCAAGPRMLRPEERKPIDRAKVEYPAGFDLERHIVGLNAPIAADFDAEGNLIITGGGVDGIDVWITGFRPDGTSFPIYPLKSSFLGIGGDALKLYGPIGGMLVHDGLIYISHRDDDDLGVISALDYQGHYKTIVAGLPAQGEHGVTDLAVAPGPDGIYRLYFGVGSATNSGIVGPDDFAMGWPKDHPKVHDIPWKTIKLWGRRVNSPNPYASPLFGVGEIMVSAPFQPYGVSNRTTVPGVVDGPENAPPKFNAGLFSIPITGGDLRAEAHGIRYPRGLAFNEYGQLYFTNNGMELRGSRPVKDDPDVLLHLLPGGMNQIPYFGWPDSTADLHPVSDETYQPPEPMILPTGYPDLSPVINREASGLSAPNPAWVQATFPSQSGAAGVTFVPSSGPFKEYFGSALVALSGDRAPFATGGQKLVGPIGSKVMRVDVDRKQVKDFIRNTQGKRASLLDNDVELLERPIDIAFGPAGNLYVLDFGRMRMRNGNPEVARGTGKVYRLFPSPNAAPRTGG